MSSFVYKEVGPEVISELHDGFGNAITSTIDGAKRGLDVNLIGGSVTITNPELQVEVDAADGDSIAIKDVTGTFAWDINAAGAALIRATSLPLPTGASQEHVTAGSPHSVRLTDGTTFYKATTPSDTQPVSAGSLPLPSGAATEATLATLLTLAGFQARINTLGQKAMASSTPVVLASDQSAIPVSQSGTWNINNISGTISLPTGAATEATLATMLTLAGFQARINTLGQKTMANSTPVVISSDQSTLPISAASLPLPSGAAQEHTTAGSPSSVRLTDGSAFYKATTPADTQPISASSLPLPTGAATEATLATMLTLAGFQARINTLGQKTMANSTPVVLASDQSNLTVNQGTAAASASRWPFQITDGTDLALVTTAGELNVLATAQPSVDIGDVTVNNTTANPIPVLGNSLTTDNPNGARWLPVFAGFIGVTPETVGAVFGPIKLDNTYRTIVNLQNTIGSTGVFNVSSSVGGDTTNGLDVDVTRVTGTVTTAPGATTNTATTVSTDTEVSVTTSTTQLLAANSSRKKVWIQNHGTGYVRVRLAATALTTSPIRLVPNVGTYELKSEDGYLYRGVINAISETGTNLVGVIEET